MTVRTRTLLIALAATSSGLAVMTLLVEQFATAAPRRWYAVAGALVAGLVALGLTQIAARRMRRRLRALEEAARRYRQGDFTQPSADDGFDELGEAVRPLELTVRELGLRLEHLRREGERVDAILSTMVEGVVLVDRAGRLVLTNPAVRSMLRLPADWRDRHYLEVVRHPEVAGQLSAALSGQLPGAAEVEWDERIRTVLVARVVPIELHRGGGAVLVLHDVTDLRHANQVRRDFVANVSHELRTPLTAIGGYVEALLDAAPAQGQQREFLSVIARHTLRMERLVRDLLRLARLDAGQEPLVRAPCDLAVVLGDVERDVESRLRQRRQRIETRVDPAGASFTADAAKVSDVLRNLIENASNYSPEGGVIEVTAERRDGEVTLSVADRGPGIPEADLRRIFERFYRVDRSRSRDPGGTGLGLSIVRHLVELHGGQVHAANRPGGGTVVTVRLGTS